MDSISFNIPGPGPHSIQPITALPPITDPVTIDGYTQPGASPNSLTNGNDAVLMIEINGSQVTTSDAPGLLLLAGNSTIRGLVINNFTNGVGHGLFILNGGTNVIEGNFIGTDIAGTQAEPNSGHGLSVNDWGHNRIGGAAPASRNVISGNEGEGIGLNGPGSSFNVVAGNYIGTDKTGTLPLGNGGNGINVTVGFSNRIGGVLAGEGNVIAHNEKNGVYVEGGTALFNSILGNSISDNIGLGIDLAPEGVTGNDAADGDSGPNNLQNFPVLITIGALGGQSIVTGAFESLPNATYAIQFFANASLDASGYGEGERLVGSKSVAVGPSGTASFSVNLNEVIPAGEWITATATDAAGNTSEFSPALRVLSRAVFELTCASNRMVECYTAWEFDPPVAAVTCLDTNVSITIVDTVTNQLVGPSYSATRTWLALDSCSNSATCSQTIYVVDTVPPDITCSPHINAAESPRDSGGGPVTFPLPVATDICDDNLTLFNTPPSGSVFPVGPNTVVSTAVDASGNTNTCDFTVRVIPYRLAVTTTADTGPGSLRQAILDANDSPDENYVYFALGEGPYVITLESALPASTSPLILDGWSQSGSNQPPVVALDGSNLTNNEDGLVIASGASLIRGLSVYGFQNGIHLLGGSNLIVGNYLGPDTTGANAPGNTENGLLIGSGLNRIVGNLISGNGTNGIAIKGMAAGTNVVQGNFIGTAADGKTELGNAGDGVFLTDQASRNLIGGTTNDAANLIAFNAGNGLSLDASAGSRNALIGNPTYANGALGIDLAADGITPNDPADSDSGPNALQNFPVLSDARAVTGVLTIDGELTSTPNTTYRLDFYLNDFADPSGNGEGQIYLGFSSVAINGSGSTTFSVSFIADAVYTQFVTATATDPFGNTSEFSTGVQVRTPPVVEVEPQGTNASAGSEVMFCVEVSGTPPFKYQWRQNGVNIPGATNECYVISSNQVADGGSYSVVIENALGALSTVSVPLTLPLPQLHVGDNFVDRVPLTGTSGIIGGNNEFATFEPDEPMHAGKPGGRSVWYTWRALVTGVTTFRTTGSTFDTLLAAYSGTTLSNLVVEGRDEDRGGAYASTIRFNSIRDHDYEIAVDGYNDTGGPFVLAWEEEDTPHLAPIFLVQPQSQTVLPGATVTFSAVAARVCGNGHSDCPIPEDYPNNELPTVNYLWLHNGEALANQIFTSLTITNVQPEDLGIYNLRVFTKWQAATSDDASLQLNFSGGTAQQVQAFDKLLDSQIFGSPLIIGNIEVPDVPALPGLPEVAAAPGVVRGFTGSQVFNTTGSATSPGEVICGVIGGASEWITFVAEETGTLFLDTDGSSYDTVIAVYRRSPTNSATLELLGCDNNSGMDGMDSALSVPVEGGTTNYILLDGVNGATGILQLNYALATTTILEFAGVTPDGDNVIRVNTTPELNFSIQGSTNMMNWTTLVTTNAPDGIYDFIDTDAQILPRRFYRALILP